MTHNFKDNRQRLLAAQEEFIHELMLNKDDQEKVITNSQYVKNWNGFVKNLDDVLQNDEIVIKDDTREFKYSKIKFLQNKYFMKSLIWNYKQKLGNVFVKLIQTKDERYLIKLTKSYPRRSSNDF